MATKNKIQAGGTPVQSSGAATVVLASVPIVNGCSYQLQARAVGRDAAGLSVSAFRTGTAKRVSGTTSLVGVDATVPLVLDAALTGAVVTLVANGNTVELQATGIVLKNIDWWGIIEGLEFAP